MNYTIKMSGLWIPKRFSRKTRTLFSIRSKKDLNKFCKESNKRLRFFRRSEKKGDNKRKESKRPKKLKLKDSRERKEQINPNKLKRKNNMERVIL